MVVMSREVTERLKSLLKAKFEGVSDSILNRISERISKSAQSVEDATTLAEGVSFQQVLESYGDSRATEAQETAIRNYEKRYGLKEGVRVEAESSVNANEEVFKEGVQDIGAKSMDAQ
ncbi:MAG TPA: hypothetical protein DDY68_02995, partial [Porphyromonadaceae bacterium]|nr:hypothetical protein [Porphyromonadaceae bacterium]